MRVCVSVCVCEGGAEVTVKRCKNLNIGLSFIFCYFKLEEISVSQRHQFHILQGFFFFYHITFLVCVYH